MTEYLNREMPVADLHVGDTIRLTDGPWGTAIVDSVGADEVTIFRPYGTTAGFTYSAAPTRVITYTGVEHVTYRRSDKAIFLVYRREH